MPALLQCILVEGLYMKVPCTAANSVQEQCFVVTMIKCFKTAALFCFLKMNNDNFFTSQILSSSKILKTCLGFVAIVAILRVWKIEIK